MFRIALSLAIVVIAAAPAPAHFVWIMPDRQNMTAQVFFSEIPVPDNPKYLDRIGQTQLYLRQADNQEILWTWTKGKEAYHVALPRKGPLTLGAVCSYGVVLKEDDVPYLLKYYAKACIPEAGQEDGKPLPSEGWDRLPLEIVQVEGKVRQFRLLWQGNPLASAEVVFLPPGKSKVEKRKTDKDGKFDVGAFKPGIYGFRTRHIETKEGEHNGQSYKEIRHYTTLVVDLPVPMRERKPVGPTVFAPLPRAVSSFGADVVDGFVYVYGGHSVPTHQYSTEAVLGTFQRLKLSTPKKWEQLTPGTPLQGLALVAHGGKLYRIGGMQPRNAAGEKADNHSVKTVARFDPATKKWDTLPDLPEGRSSHDAVVVGDKLMVVGGWTLNGAGKKSDWLSTAPVLDLTKQPLKWETITQPFQRRALTAAVHGGKVYVIGGIAESGDIELTVDVYDPAMKSWTKGPDLPAPQKNGFGPAACVADGSLYVSIADGRLLRLSENGDAWAEAGRLMQPRIVHRMVAANGRLIAIGGAFGGNNISLTEALVPQPVVKR